MGGGGGGGGVGAEHAERVSSRAAGHLVRIWIIPPAAGWLPAAQCSDLP